MHLFIIGNIDLSYFHMHVWAIKKRDIFIIPWGLPSHQCSYWNTTYHAYRMVLPTLDSCLCLDGQWPSEGIYKCVCIYVNIHVGEMCWVVGIVKPGGNASNLIILFIWVVHYYIQEGVTVQFISRWLSVFSIIYLH